MNTSLSLPDVYRTQHVRRWHIVHSRREQSLAEHIYMVAMISIAILDEFGVQELQLRNWIMEWALLHDLPEVVMGDTTSPVKAKTKEAFNEIEEVVDPKFKEFERQMPRAGLAIVKMADYIDALKFLQTEGVNGQAQSVYEKLYTNFCNYIEYMKKEKPDWPWGRCEKVLLQILSGEETFIDKLI